MTTIYSIHFSIIININMVIYNRTISRCQPASSNITFYRAPMNIYLVIFYTFTASRASSFTAIYILIKSPSINYNRIIMSYDPISRTINRRCIGCISCIFFAQNPAINNKCITVT